MTKILLTGKTGQLGWELQHALAPLGEIIAPSHNQLDLTNPETIQNVIRATGPDIIVNAAGYTAVDKAETERGLAYQINAAAPGVMAEEARRAGVLLVHYSTDYVYDGTKGTSYDEEEDVPNPVNFYGRTKLAGERAILASGCRHLIFRASWIYSMRRTNFVLTMLRLARENYNISVVTDQIGCPSWARCLATTSAEVVLANKNMQNTSGIYHLSSTGHAARFDFAKMILDLAKQSSSPNTVWANIQRTTTDKYPLPAKRPLYVSTSKAKVNQCFGVNIATWQDQLKLFMKSLPD